MIRIQKFLAEQGLGSRRTIESWIENRDIWVDGIPAELGQKVDGSEHFIVRGKPFFPRKISQKKLVAFYKPVGVECTMKPLRNQKTLANFNFGPQRVFPVGRLDKDSEGLLLLTDHGDFANKMMHPRYEHKKTYQVTVDTKISAEILKTLANGSIQLDDRPVSPCKTKRLGDFEFEIVLTEGRNRQIRRMCEACGVRVTKLKRTKIEHYQLQTLKSGHWREEKFPPNF